MNFLLIQGNRNSSHVLMISILFFLFFLFFWVIKHQLFIQQYQGANCKIKPNQNLKNKMSLSPEDVCYSPTHLLEKTLGPGKEKS